MKMFIGHFGDKKKKNWFLCWAKDESDARITMDSAIGEPIFIEELTFNQPGFICFTVEEEDEGELGKEFFLNAIPDELVFIEEDVVMQIIQEERDIPIEKTMAMIEKNNQRFYKKWFEEHRYQEKWLTDYLLQDYLIDDDIKNMSDEEIKSTWEKARKDFDKYSKKRDGPLEKKHVKKAVEGIPYLKHFEEKAFVTNNMAVTRGEMDHRCFSTIYNGLEGKG